MKKSIFIFVMLLPLVSFGQDFKFIPLKYDQLWSEDGLIIKFDAVEHAIRDGAIFYGLGRLGLSDKWRFGVTTGFSVAWEIRDGFAWRKTDGYSWKDLAAGIAGQGIVYLGEKIFDKPKPKKYNEALRKASEVALRLSTDGAAIPCPDGIAGCAVNHVILKSGVKDASSN